MIHLGLKTEYSFKKCFGHIEQIVKHEAEQGKTAVGIADIDNTFGHIQFNKACQKHGIKPIFGIRLRVLPADNKQRTGQVYTTIIAKNNKGVKEIYKLAKRAWDEYYYFPRIKGTIESPNLFVLSPFTPSGIYLGDTLRSTMYEGVPAIVPVIDNYYIKPEDRKVYELLAGRTRRGDQYFYNFETSTHPMHIMSDAEVFSEFDCTLSIADLIANECNAELEHAPMVKYTGYKTLKEVCDKNKKMRVGTWNQEYEDRYQREMQLIKDKGYEDYFMIVADMINWAKHRMLVGPSRGSSAGSLVCYLIGITEVDPIKYNLIFERFIDINRFDLPDIDVDFPDSDRKAVVEYLVKKYGKDNVMTLANIARFKPKSAIGEFAAGLGIPKYETEAVKGAIIERSSGDARAAMCIADTFDTTDPGKEFIEKYPHMRLVSHIEGHASHSGKHAAGVIVSTKELTTYCGVNNRDEVCMLDKKDAEEIGLLKIDCLGLRTLSILQDAAKLCYMDYKKIYKLPLDDQKTFDVFNSMRLSGVFQFEGYALQSLTRQMGVHRFEDIVAITSLARPGALNSGGASRYVKYRTGVEEPVYINEDHKQITEETYGITVYQEQMMEIARKVGKLSWEDTSTLRKAASKSMGDEFFGKYKAKFVDGAINKSGLTEEEAEDIWNDISHSGSWSFNKSHAVSYGLISYWTAWFKANHPLEFAVASLNNARDNDHAIKLLRDMYENDGLEHIPVMPERSDINWSVYNGKLLGGLTNIKGIGEKKAADFIAMRQGKRKPTPSFWKMLEDPVTDFDVIFPTRHYWGKLFTDPRSYGLQNPPVNINTIEGEGEYMFVGCLVDRNLRDLNEYTFLKDRNMEIIEEKNLYLNMTVEDDTDSIICSISRWKFDELGGKKIAEEGKVGESWYLIKGTVRGSWRKVNIDYIINLNEHLGDLTDES